MAKLIYLIYILFAFACLNPSTSLAGPAYFELGFGGAKFSKGSGIFNSASAESTRFGFGLNWMLGWNLNRTSSPLSFHIGLKHRISNGEGSDGTHYVLQGFYPMVRLEFPRFYLGAGATPLVFATANPDTPDVTTLTRAANTIGAFGEVGLLWKVTYFFHFAIEGAASYGFAGPTMSPAPALDITAQLRFFINPKDDEGKNRVKFDGWRYPFGIEISSGK